MKGKARETETAVDLTLIDSELRYRRLFETAQDGILILDAESGTIMDVNPYLIIMLGYSLPEFIRKQLWEVGAFKDIEANREAFRSLQEKEYIRYDNLPLRAKDGRLIQVEFVSNVYQVGEQQVIQCNIRNITGRMQVYNALVESEAMLREQSVRDHLTGLFNRRYMEETLERELLRASRQQHSLSIVMLDVDHFKSLNDAHGHAAGDAVLSELGKLLTAHVRGGDAACRYGGDEFMLLLLDVSQEVTWKRTELIRQYARLMRVQIEGRVLDTVTLSMGVSFFPADGSTSAVILKNADDALYRAKHEGRDRVVVTNRSPGSWSVPASKV